MRFNYFFFITERERFQSSSFHSIENSRVEIRSKIINYSLTKKNNILSKIYF